MTTSGEVMARFVLGQQLGATIFKILVGGALGGQENEGNEAARTTYKTARTAYEEAWANYKAVRDTYAAARATNERAWETYEAGWTAYQADKRRNIAIKVCVSAIEFCG